MEFERFTDIIFHTKNSNWKYIQDNGKAKRKNTWYKKLSRTVENKPNAMVTARCEFYEPRNIYEIFTMLKIKNWDVRPCNKNCICFNIKETKMTPIWDPWRWNSDKATQSVLQANSIPIEMIPMMMDFVHIKNQFRMTL